MALISTWSLAQRRDDFSDSRHILNCDGSLTRMEWTGKLELYIFMLRIDVSAPGSGCWQQ